MVVEDPSLNPKPESSMVFFFGWERELTWMMSFSVFRTWGSLQSVLFRVGEITHWTQVLVFWTCWQIDMYALRMH